SSFSCFVLWPADLRDHLPFPHDALPICAQRREAERKAESRRELLRRLGFALGMGALVVAIFVVVNLLGQNRATLPGGYQDYRAQDRKSTRLNSSHVKISYAVFCLKKNKS